MHGWCTYGCIINTSCIHTYPPNMLTLNTKTKSHLIKKHTLTLQQWRAGQRWCLTHTCPLLVPLPYSFALGCGVKPMCLSRIHTPNPPLSQVLISRFVVIAPSKKTLISSYHISKCCFHDQIWRQATRSGWRAAHWLGVISVMRCWATLIGSDVLI